MKLSHKLLGPFAALLLFIFFIGCNNDDGSITDDVVQTDDDVSGGDDDAPPPVEGLEVFNADLVYDGFILVNDASANRVYLMNKEAATIFEWNLNGSRLGNDAFLLPNGQLLTMLESESPEITLGGFGGVIALLDKDGGVEWSYEYSSSEHIAHHDAVMLPNGNILFLTWERKSMEEATEIGFSAGTQVIYDAVFEIDPSTDEIVWQWHMWDHLVQDFDDTKLNFGSVADNPNRIDINYLEVPNDDGDVSHANGLAYDAENDLIYISANFYSEVWVIDHSTSTAEAQTGTGGNFGVGGDLLYRFGNPTAYKNDQGVRRFDRNHHPNLLTGESAGNMLIFANGFNAAQSTVYELEMPSTFSLLANTDNEPEVVWSFTDTDLFSGRVSGAVALPNGNRLITEGDFGFWEVDRDGGLVWRYTTPGFFWRGYHYDKDAPEIQSLGL
ncbi:MAG: aryl-sulfate sulfotransferase [Flavobacteriaceae bacterium]|nr:aryl-sulfate sulfotransferase [Flavobacteriaceae bacterium]